MEWRVGRTDDPSSATATHRRLPAHGQAELLSLLFTLQQELGHVAIAGINITRKPCDKPTLIGKLVNICNGINRFVFPLGVVGRGATASNQQSADSA